MPGKRHLNLAFSPSLQHRIIIKTIKRKPKHNEISPRLTTDAPSSHRIRSWGLISPWRRRSRRVAAIFKSFSKHWNKWRSRCAEKESGSVAFSRLFRIHILLSVSYYVFMGQLGLVVNSNLYHSYCDILHNKWTSEGVDALVRQGKFAFLL